MGNLHVWDIFASLGIPGLAFGVFYMLFRKLEWRLPGIKQVWVGPLLLLLMLLTSGLVLTALILWAPESESSTDSQDEPITEFFHGEPEVAGEFVAMGETPLSLEEAEALQNDLSKLSKLAKEITPEGSWLEGGGTYNSIPFFAMTDVLVVRSLRNPGKWEVVIDLVSRIPYEDAGIMLPGENEERAESALWGIQSGCDDLIFGADPKEAPEIKEFYELADRLRNEYFEKMILQKYSILEFEKQYGMELRNVALKE